MRIRKIDGYTKVKFSGIPELPFVVPDEESGIAFFCGFDSFDSCGTKDKYMIINGFLKLLDKTFSTIILDVNTDDVCVEGFFDGRDEELLIESEDYISTSGSNMELTIIKKK